MGDIVHTFPSITLIKNEFPEAKIHWLVDGKFSSMVKTHPYVDNILSVDIRKLKKYFFKYHYYLRLITFVIKNYNKKYDLIIDFQGLFKSALLSLIFKGHRIGFANSNIKEPVSMIYSNTYSMEKKLHAVEKNLSLICQHLNLPKKIFEYYPDYYFEFDSKVNKNILFITCASKIKKKWHIYGWKELLGIFLKKNFHIFFTAGNKEELDYVNEIKSENNCTIIFDEDLLQVIEKLKSMHLVIGLDTGLTHASNALGIPTVGLFINSSPELTGLFGNTNSLNLLSNLDYKKDCLEILNFYEKIYK